MVNKRARITGKGRDRQFFALPHSIIRHERFSYLSAFAIKLLVDLGGQYNGFNNGQLMATWSFLNKEKGWKSKGTLYKARKELIEAGLIIISRTGGKNKPTLYALTFQSIDDDKKGILQIKPTNAPFGAWKNPDEYPKALFQ